MNVTRDNHFVPAFLQKGWSDDDVHVPCYRLLVPHHNYPVWTDVAIKKVACWRDLYTSPDGTQLSDAFERWVEKNFETPVQDPMNRTIQGEALTDEDWTHLARFFAAQDVRTIQSFTEFLERMREFQPRMQRTMQDCEKRLEAAQEREEDLAPRRMPAGERDSFANMFKIEIQQDAGSEPGMARIKATMLADRESWLEQQRHLLINRAAVLAQHDWCIAEAVQGSEWFLTDHPAVRLNYSSPGRFDIRGGWGNPGTNLLMPLSPRHLLVAEVGRRLPDRLKLTRQQTRLLQEAIVERASQFIIARTKPLQQRVETLRPRRVDLKAYRHLEEQRDNFNEIQMSAQLAFEET